MTLRRRGGVLPGILLGIVLAAGLLPGPAGRAATPAPSRPPAPADAADPAGPATDLATLRNETIAAYNALNYPKAAQLAARYLDRARTEGRTGREVAALSFILGHARYEIHRAAGGPYAGDYRAEVVMPLDESLRVLQDDPAFKNMMLGNAWHELWVMTDRKDDEAEERDHWYLLKSILIRRQDAGDTPPQSPGYDPFARHVLFYLERCLELARSSSHADLYAQRIRSVAPWGFGTAYEARFWQIHDLTYFDDGNMQAAALWQHGLDLMRDPKTDPNETLSVFQSAAERTHRRHDRAEVYRQMSDFVSTLDAPERRVQAVDFAHRAFDLNPGDAEIRRQYGTALHLLSYAAYASGRFDEALRRAEESITFEWDGMEVALWDLSRAAAELGRETEALTHGERAFRMARGRLAGAALQPFAQNYVNILRQFGQEGLAARVQQDNASLGVR